VKAGEGPVDVDSTGGSSVIGPASSLSAEDEAPSCFGVVDLRLVFAEGRKRGCPGAYRLDPLVPSLVMSDVSLGDEPVEVISQTEARILPLPCDGQGYISFAW
jgi:hypothetical protein